MKGETGRVIYKFEEACVDQLLGALGTIYIQWATVIGDERLALE